MKKFSFKFESVLQNRKSKEDQALSQLGAARKKYQDELDKRARLLNEIDQSFARQASLNQLSVKITAFQFEEDYRRGLKQRIVWTNQAIQRANHRMIQAFREYLVVRKKSLALTTLKDQAILDHKKLKNRMEQKELDDLMIMRARLKGERE